MRLRIAYNDTVYKQIFPYSFNIVETFFYNKQRQKVMDGIKIRKYREDDYEQVVRIFENGINDTHINYLTTFYNGKFPNLIAFEMLFFTSGYFFGYYRSNQSYVVPIVFGVLFVATFCFLSFWMRWRWNKIYIR